MIIAERIDKNRRSAIITEGGFSLVETILVIVIMGILAFVVSLNLGGLDDIKLNNAARKLASDIRFAQQMAITKQNRHGVVFNIPDPNKYTVYELDDPTDPARDPAGGRDFIMDYTTGEFNGITISSNLPQDGSSRRLVKFNSQGEPLGGDDNPLVVSNNTVTLSYQGNPKTVTVEPTTGRVSY